MLLNEAQCILGGMRRRPGNHQSRVVVLLLERALDFLPAFWACVLGGYIPCPVAPAFSDQERWAKTIAHANDLLGRPLFIGTARSQCHLPTTVDSVNLADLRQSPPFAEPSGSGLLDTAILMLTSGSTGNSKAVALTNANVLASMAGKNKRQLLTASDITLNWISFDHVAALLEAHLLPLSVGATQLHVESAAILADPMLFLRLIDQFRISMTFSPNFLFGQINAELQRAVTRVDSNEQRLTFDLSCVRHIISGGEANAVETCRRFLDLLAKGKIP
jgi:acyl-CoA synthetase (AMP-forming)/AMP-acid ligase II